MQIQADLLSHQLKFVTDIEHRSLALVAGYGSGKTYAFCMKGIYLASLNPGMKGALLEPTNAMCADVLVPELTTMLVDLDIPYTYRASPYPSFTLHFEDGDSTILIRSAENYRRLAGLNLAWFGVDEADTISKVTAFKMWRLLISRLRAPNANVYQGFTTSTPEGYNFLYEYFVSEVREGIAEGKDMSSRHIIHARTADNPFLDDDFIPSLMAAYPANLIVSYLEGKFTNLNQGTVYYAFNRDVNNTDKMMEDFIEFNLQNEPIEYPELHIGMDFNVGKCCSIIHCVDEDNVVYAVDEINGIKNTEAMIKEIKKLFPKYPIIVYPDASSRSEKTNASTTDLRMLKKEFDVRALKKNPLVKDRINSMNAMFLNGDGNTRYYVNTRKCRKYAEALETQAYKEDGTPDKSHDQDHPVDAGGYFIYKRYPLRTSHRKVTIVGR